MTIKKLIEELQKYDENLEVRYCDCHNGLTNPIQKIVYHDSYTAPRSWVEVEEKIIELM